jgi:lipid-binding SYLF domain-containing protein
MPTRKKLTMGAYFLLLLALVAPNTSYGAQEKNKNDAKDKGEEAERALSAANVVTEIMNAPDTSIPEELMQRAQAIAVVPNVVKAALGVGGRHGKGIVARRLPDKTWGAPAFVDISGGSFGLQLGVSVTDLILVFTNEDGLKGLFEDKVELGGDAGVAAGPVGRSAEAGTNVTFDSPIYSYSRSKGLFAGIALKGTVMTIDDSSNHKVYGENVSGRDILLRGAVRPVREVKPFLAALNREAGRVTEHQTKTDASKDRIARADPAAASPAGGHTLTNREVKQIQSSLQEKGYYKAAVDGVIGPATREAIRQYQKAENLPVTGRPDLQTTAKLGVARP